MSNSITVTCGQCQCFTRHDENYTDEHGNNGLCAEWMREVCANDSMLELSQFYDQQLGGRPINDETPRHCLKFTGKYPFVVGA